MYIKRSAVSFEYQSHLDQRPHYASCVLDADIVEILCGCFWWYIGRSLLFSEMNAISTIGLGKVFRASKNNVHWIYTHFGTLLRLWGWERPVVVVKMAGVRFASRSMAGSEWLGWVADSSEPHRMAFRDRSVGPAPSERSPWLTAMQGLMTWWHSEKRSMAWWQRCLPKQTRGVQFHPSQSRERHTYKPRYPNLKKNRRWNVKQRGLPSF